MMIRSRQAIRRQMRAKALSRYAQIEDLSFSTSEISQLAIEQVGAVKNLARKIREYQDVIPSQVDSYFKTAAQAFQQAYQAMMDATRVLTDASESIQGEYDEETDS